MHREVLIIKVLRTKCGPCGCAALWTTEGRASGGTGWSLSSPSDFLFVWRQLGVFKDVLALWLWGADTKTWHQPAAFLWPVMKISKPDSAGAVIHSQAALLTCTHRILGPFSGVVAVKLTSHSLLQDYLKYSAMREASGESKHNLTQNAQKPFTSVASFITSILRALTRSMRSAGVTTWAWSWISSTGCIQSRSYYCSPVTHHSLQYVTTSMKSCITSVVFLLYCLFLK